MSKSHVLIACDDGAEKIVSSEINKMGDAIKIARTYGYYDLVVELEAKNEEELKKIIGSKIKNIKSIRSALTLIHA